jgi:hypothetical protein
MYAQYKSPNDATLSYMEDALHHFRTFKDVFFLGRAGTKAKNKANALENGTSENAHGRRGHKS